MKIALDVDDVLAAFSAHCAAFHGKPHCKMDYWCTKTMNDYYGEGWFDDIQTSVDFWATIPRLSDPKDIDFDVHCYISAFPSYMADVRTEWLERNGFPKRSLVCSHDKLASCRALGIDVLIDDKPALIQQLLGTEIKGIHFITPYAGFEPVGTYITNLKQVKQALNEITFPSTRHTH